jgi:methylated-DNA-protein-cysteine methyltransferase-like protein
MTSEMQFAERVRRVVEQIPKGRVMTYGQIAGLCGSARAARIVGGLAHFGDLSLPWHRVVNKKGGLAVGYPGGREGHKRDLEREGIQVSGSNGDYWVDVSSLLWSPA